MEKFDTTSPHQEASSDSVCVKYDAGQGTTTSTEDTPTTGSVTSNRTTRKKWPRRLAIGITALVLVALVACGAFAVYASDYYHATDTAQASLISTEQLPVEQGMNYVAFGNPDAAVGFVFYPGAKVEYTSYAPLMCDLANRGYFVVVVEMPFNFALFDINAADRIWATYPQVKQWWVGGHSLGGSMAAQYAAGHTDDANLTGVVLLGAYTASDLSASDLGIIAVYGSSDLVLNRNKLNESVALMPSDALVLELSGGNHAQFGSYGAQAGDGTPSITPDDQWKQTADAIDEYVSSRADTIDK